MLDQFWNSGADAYAVAQIVIDLRRRLRTPMSSKVQWSVVDPMQT
jgi:hypothetical protein